MSDVISMPKQHVQHSCHYPCSSSVFSIRSQLQCAEFWRSFLRFFLWCFLFQIVVTKFQTVINLCASNACRNFVFGNDAQFTVVLASDKQLTSLRKSFVSFSLNSNTVAEICS